MVDLTTANKSRVHFNVHVVSNSQFFKKVCRKLRKKKQIKKKTRMLLSIVAIYYLCWQFELKNLQIMVMLCFIFHF